MIKNTMLMIPVSILTLVLAIELSPRHFQTISPGSEIGSVYIPISLADSIFMSLPRLCRVSLNWEILSSFSKKSFCICS